MKIKHILDVKRKELARKPDISHNKLNVIFWKYIKLNFVEIKKKFKNYPYNKNHSGSVVALIEKTDANQ